MKFLVPIILAAGESRRMKKPKPYLPISGATFLEKIANDLREAGVSLWGGVVYNTSHEDLIKNLRLSRLQLIPNNRQELGQIYSLQLALNQIAKKNCDAIICLADHPLVDRETYRILLKARVESPGKIIIPTYKKKRGHPIIIPGGLFSEILSFPPEKAGGMREILRGHADLIREIPTEDEGVLADLDTPKDLARL